MVSLKYLLIFYMEDRLQIKIQTLVNSAEMNAAVIRGNQFQSLDSNDVSSCRWYEPLIKQAIDTEKAPFTLNSLIIQIQILPLYY